MKKIKDIKIGNVVVGKDKHCVVISEIGAMYEDLEGMKKLISLSKEAGADIIKLQTYRAETISMPGAIFELEDGSKVSQFDFFKKYEISIEDHKVLFDYANSLKIPIFSTPSYYNDVDFLDELGVPAFKTGSDDLTNYPFLEYIAKKGKPMIVSTGMSTLEEVDGAVDAILKTGNDQLILLHCTVSYPSKKEYANLNVIKTLSERFNLLIGFSDHLPGIFPSCVAASVGACIIEKHVTLDRSLKRADYQVSIEPMELKELSVNVKSVPTLLGSFEKKVYSTEEKWRKNARKSLHSSKLLKKDDLLKIEDIKIIRPGEGIPPKGLNDLVGKTLKVDVPENTLIKEEFFS